MKPDTKRLIICIIWIFSIVGFVAAILTILQFFGVIHIFCSAKVSLEADFESPVKYEDIVPDDATGRYYYAEFCFKGTASCIRRNRVHLVVHPTYPSGGGYWIKEASTSIGQDASFTDTITYGIDTAWDKAKYEFEVFAIVVPSGTEIGPERYTNLEALRIKARSDPVTIVIGK